MLECEEVFMLEILVCWRSWYVFMLECEEVFMLEILVCWRSWYVGDLGMLEILVCWRSWYVVLAEYFQIDVLLDRQNYLATKHSFFLKHWTRNCDFYQVAIAPPGRTIQT